MNKKIAIIAIAVVAIVVVGAFAVTMLGGDDDEKVVYWTPIGPNLQKEALIAGQIDGAITWEPFASDALLSGEASIYKWSNEIWEDHPCCVVAVDDSFLASNRDLALRTLKAHMVATEWIIDTITNPSSENYSMMLQMGAEFSQRSIEVVNSSLSNIVFTYNMTDAFEEWMEVITQKYIDLDLIQESVLETRGYDDVGDFVEKYFDSSLIEEAADIEPSSTILNAGNPVRLGYLIGDLHQFSRVVANNDTIWGDGKDLFEVYGVATEISEGGPYVNGGAVMNAFAAGYVDVGYLGSPPAILNHLNGGVEVTVIAQVNMVGSAIFVNDEITTLDDFNGKVIATPGISSIQHLMFLDYFTSNGFTVKAL